MILNEKGAPIEAADSPPAYDELDSQNSTRFSGDSKNRGGLESHPPQAGSSRTPVATTPPLQSPYSNANAYTSGTTNKKWFSWFGEKGGGNTRNEVKQTIQSLIRDVVQEPSSPAAVSVLQSCLEACQARDLSFQSIVSEKFIEGHCPLYWAIVKRPAKESEEPDDRVQLLDILLSIPLDATTRTEAYLACLLSSDQVLFQRLRHTPGNHSPSVSAAHELLLGDAPKDDVRSFDMEGDHGEFRVVWKIAQFQKRMRVIGGVGTEVVARGRIWSLAFAVLPRDVYCSGSHYKAGTWVASVSLLFPSPPTYLDSQVSIFEPNPDKNNSSELPTLPLYPLLKPDLPPGASPAPTPPQNRKSPFISWPGSNKESRKPPIILRLKTGPIVTQLEPLPIQSKKQDLRDHVLSSPGSKTLIMPLNNHPNGDGLQFDGCSYLNPDGSLNVTFEGRLAKSDSGAECIIC